jgi:hypothetical protein
MWPSIWKFAVNLINWHTVPRALPSRFCNNEKIDIKILLLPAPSKIHQRSLDLTSTTATFQLMHLMDTYVLVMVVEVKSEPRYYKIGEVVFYALSILICTSQWILGNTSLRVRCMAHNVLGLVAQLLASFSMTMVEAALTAKECLIISGRCILVLGDSFPRSQAYCEEV